MVFNSASAHLFDHLLNCGMSSVTRRALLVSSSKYFTLRVNAADLLVLTGSSSGILKPLSESGCGEEGGGGVTSLTTGSGGIVMVPG